MSKTLYATVTGVSNIIGITVSTSHSSSYATAEIQCTSTTLGLGDSVVINLGYTTDYGKVFTGIVKQIRRDTPDDIYTIVCHDVLTQAVDYFIASEDPNAPLTYNNIDAEDLVGNLMSLAGLTSYQYDATSFTFGVINPVEINLVSSYDYSREVGDLLAWHLYADENGVVQFRDRRPYIMDGSTLSGRTDSTPDASFTDSNIITINYGYDERDLRNRVVVYGVEGVYAVASASSPHLPAGFYKTVAVGSQILDRQSLASASASYNLDLLNKLKYSLTVVAEGNYRALARKIIYVTSAYYPSSPELWYAYSVDHSWSSGGYQTTMELRKVA